MKACKGVNRDKSTDECPCVYGYYMKNTDLSKMDYFHIDCFSKFIYIYIKYIFVKIVIYKLLYYLKYAFNFLYFS